MRDLAFEMCAAIAHYRLGLRVKLSGGLDAPTGRQAGAGGKLHAEINVYTAIGAQLGSLVELATSKTAAPDSKETKPSRPAEWCE